MALKKCCEQYVFNCSPKAKREGRFSEIHACPTCKSKIKIDFECFGALGDDDIHCAALSANNI